MSDSTLSRPPGDGREPPRVNTLTAGQLAPGSGTDADTRTGGGGLPAAGGPSVVPAPPGYEVVRELGRGGMGVVYEARDLALNRTVALKMVLAGGHARAAELARFLHEAEAVARLDHPHVVRVFALGNHDGLPFFAMEYVDGGSLADAVRGGPLPPADAARYVAQVAAAVGYSHARGVLHRDLKPANILLAKARSQESGSRSQDAGSKSGSRSSGVTTGLSSLAPGSWPLTPKVTDFGLAKLTDGDDDGLTATGAVMGTPSYMAPEQAAGGGKDVGPAADVYSLGAVLYALLTGRPPFQGPTPVETVRQVIDSEPVAPRRLQPGTPKDLETITLKCLAKDPAKRYPSADALADDLGRWLSGESIVARPAGPVERGWKWVRRNRGAAAAGAAVFLALAAGTAVSTWQAVRARAAEGRTAQLLAGAYVTQNQLEVKTAQASEEAANARRAEALAVEREGKEKAAREEAERQKSAAVAVRGFLQDVFTQGGASGQANAIRRVKADLTVKAAMDVAAARAGLQFVKQPLIEADLRNTIGETYRDLGALSEAEGQLRRAVALRRKHLPPDDPDRLTSINNLGLVAHDLGQYDEAAALMREALAGWERVGGADHPEALTSLNNLVLVHGSRGEFAAGLPLAVRVLAGQRKARGESNQAALLAAANLGWFYLRTGQLDKAAPLLEDTLSGMKFVLGADHPLTLTTLGNVALLHYNKGELAEAERLYEEARAAAAKALGPDHPQTLLLTHDLGVAVRDRGDLARAADLLAAAYAGRRKALGPAHPDTLWSAHIRAWVAHLRGDGAAAEAGLRDVLARRGKAFGPAHPDTAAARTDLSQVLTGRGKAAEAAALMRERVAALTTDPAHGPSGFATAGAQAMLAYPLVACRQYAEAEAVLRACLATREKADPELWTVFNTRSLLGEALYRQGKFAEAEPLVLGGYQGLKERRAAIPPAGRARPGEAARRVVDLYAAWGKPADAAAWREKLAADLPPLEAAPPPRAAR